MRPSPLLCSVALSILAGGCQSSSDTSSGDASGPPVGDAGSPSMPASDAGSDATATDAATSDATVSDAMVSDATPSDATPSDADASIPSTVTIAGSASDAGILGITVAPLALVPAFSPGITDYYVRCAASS